MTTMAGSIGRKTVSVQRGFMMLCETCYDEVITEKLVDGRNYVRTMKGCSIPFVRDASISIARSSTTC